MHAHARAHTTFKMRKQCITSEIISELLHSFRIGGDVGDDVDGGADDDAGDDVDGDDSGDEVDVSPFDIYRINERVVALICWVVGC